MFDGFLSLHFFILFFLKSSNPDSHYKEWRNLMFWERNIIEADKIV